MNTTDDIIDSAFRTRLKVDLSIKNRPDSVMDSLLGVPYDIIPDAPGVLVFHREDGSALTIDACFQSMRRMAIRAYQGLRGRERARSTHISFAACDQPAERAVLLTSDHVRMYGTLPLAAAS